MTTWFFSHGHQKLYIFAERWHEACQYAKAIFQTDAPEWRVSEQEPDVMLRFVGDDYDHGGSKNCRRMQVREITNTGWSDWRNC